MGKTFLVKRRRSLCRDLCRALRFPDPHATSAGPPAPTGHPAGPAGIQLRCAPMNRSRGRIGPPAIHVRHPTCEPPAPTPMPPRSLRRVPPIRFCRPPNSKPAPIRVPPIQSARPRSDPRAKHLVPAPIRIPSSRSATPSSEPCAFRGPPAQIRVPPIQPGAFPLSKKRTPNLTVWWNRPSFLIAEKAPETSQESLSTELLVTCLPCRPCRPCRP